MREESFGIIPIREVREGRQLLMVKHAKGHWAFPKGHANEGESSQKAAIRELKEEVGLRVASFLKAAPLHEAYSFERGGQRVDKQVTYYIAFVTGVLRIDGREIVDARWLSFEEAHTLATFEECKRLVLGSGLAF